MPDPSSSDSDARTSDAEFSEHDSSAVASPSRTWSGLRVWLIAGAVLAIPLALYAIALVTQSGSIPRGTTVAGVDIGGLDRDEAVARLDDELTPRLSDDLIVRAGDETAIVIPKGAGVTLDADATVEAAGTTGRDPIAAIRGLFGAAPAVEPVVEVDDKKMKGSTDWAAKKLDRKVREGAIEFEGAGYKAVKPLEGRTVEAEPLAVAIAAQAVDPTRELTAPVSTVDPEVDQAAVDAAVESIGKPAVSGPVTVSVNGPGADDTSVKLAVARYTPFLSTTAKDGALALVVDGDGLRTSLSSSLGGIQVEAKDATFRIVSGRPVVVPSVNGRSVSTDELAKSFAGAVVAEDKRVAVVALSAEEPELTTEKARALGVTERLSSFRQPFPYAPYRYQNIGQAAERVNGTLLRPDETFSMNDTVLERTRANGYTEGFVITDGRLVEDLGGGVSTMATALWDAAFFAGLERVEQRAHSFYISRYKPGLEATVSWGNLDLRFRNNTGKGVFITAVRERSGVTVTMYGTKKVDVSAVFGPRTNPKPYSRVIDTSSTCSPQAGVNGFTIVVTRVVERDNGETTREPLKTVYRPAANVVCRPKPAPKPSATSAPATSAPATSAPATKPPS